MVIASADVTTDLAKLADMADKVLEVATHPNTVSAVRHSPNTDEVKKLKEEVTRLADLVASLISTHSRCRSLISVVTFTVIVSCYIIRNRI